MSDMKKIIELNNLISDNNSLQNDITEISNLIKTMFQKKYISKLSDELKIQKQNHQKNPSKEIQLIQAVKPFISQSRHNDIDKITDALINITTLMDIQKDFLENTKKNNVKQTPKKQILPEKQISAMDTTVTQKEDSSIKKDGVYDIDEICLLSNQSIKQNSNQNFLALYILLIAVILKNN